jgi:ABC-2 type transport system ATP-binding protein
VGEVPKSLSNNPSAPDTASLTAELRSGAAISAIDVHKRFGPVEALRGIDVSVMRGEVVALLGPNGAGKSTFMRILATAVLPDRGEVRVGGFDVVDEPRKARASLGIALSDERSFFWRLSGAANLQFFASLHGMRRREAADAATEALADVGLAYAAEQRVDRYSTGMRARLGIARALLGHPRALLLDEFTRSVDTLGTIEVRELITKMAKDRRVAILLATHDLHEAAAMADRTIILVAGRVARTLERGHDAARLESLLLEAITQQKATEGRWPPTT